MSICDLDKVDAVGKDKNENALRMMLADSNAIYSTRCSTKTEKY